MEKERQNREEYEEEVRLALKELQEWQRELGRPVTTDETRERVLRKLVEAEYGAKTSESTQTDN